jgi:ATP-dependent Zn protease
MARKPKPTPAQIPDGSGGEKRMAGMTKQERSELAHKAAAGRWGPGTRLIRREPRVYATAYHEAAHAVPAFVMNLKFHYVTIKPSDDSSGHVEHRRNPKWFQPELDNCDRVRLHGERHIVGSLAGQISEAKFRRKQPRYGMESDNRQAVDIAFELCGSQQASQKFLDYCYAVSKDIVKGSWPDIKTVATALLARETLSYKDVRDVILGRVPSLPAMSKPTKGNDARASITLLPLS